MYFFLQKKSISSGSLSSSNFSHHPKSHQETAGHSTTIAGHHIDIHTIITDLKIYNIYRESTHTNILEKENPSENSVY